jgi:hypothetical protein
LRDFSEEESPGEDPLMFRVNNGYFMWRGRVSAEAISIEKAPC